MPERSTTARFRRATKLTARANADYCCCHAPVVLPDKYLGYGEQFFDSQTQWGCIHCPLLAEAHAADVMVTGWHDGFNYPLPGEAPGPDAGGYNDIHFHPVEPLSFRLGVSAQF